MSKFTDTLTPDLIKFIEAQHMFFVATGTAAGRINLSPKGMDTFRVLSEREAAYLDLTGSGNETAAHLRHDGRITVMFCSFTAKPLILRVYGRGRVILPDDAAWPEAARAFPALAGQRQIISISVESAQTSCGFAVPMYDLVRERNGLVEWAQKKGENGLRQYRRKNNLTSIDGLPAYDHDPEQVNSHE